MRILHIEKMLFYDSGVTSFVRALSEFQRRRGHDVFFFGCSSPDNPSGAVRFFDFTRSRNPFDLIRMIHSTQAANELSKFLWKNPVDIAHVHNIYHHLTPSIMEVLVDRRVPIVMTVHDYRLLCPTKHFLRLSYTENGRGGEICFRCLPNRFYHAAALSCCGLAGVGLAIESYFQRFFRRYYQPVEIFFCPTHFM
ncbi:MAG: glycosyltransferase, partial [Planctomycetes bacterium]|nr:glycosyltransferase [Planctomycetota bacterium]